MKQESTIFIYDEWHCFYTCEKCGLEFCFEDGGPKDNECYYCPKCGRYIEKVKTNFKVPFCDEDCAHAYELRRKM